MPILRGQAQGIAGRIALLAGRRPGSVPDLAPPPDSALARAAEEAAAEQPVALLGHAHRTWCYGSALAAVDGVDLDQELFYVAALLHDTGLASAVTGEDFTLRSARCAAPIVERHRDADQALRVSDAITAHATPGATLDHDGPEAVYVQAGATCDLGGLRLHHLSAAFVDETLQRHPRGDVKADIIARIRAEAAAVPDGRFSLLRRMGFGVAVRLAPFR